MECNHFNFGIIDQDCFVLDGRFFSRLQIADNEFAISPFSCLNKKSNITFPRTYLSSIQHFGNSSHQEAVQSQFQTMLDYSIKA